MQHLHRLTIRVAILAVFLGVLPVLSASDRSGGQRTEDAALFSAQEYQDHIAYLAGNDLEGRGTGQEGIEKAAEYVASVFQQNGLRTAGDDNTYFQNFTLERTYRIGEGTSLAVGTKGRLNRRRLDLHTDYVPFPFSETKAFAGGVVFAGYGIVSKDRPYDDYAGLDVADKVVLVLRGTPRFAEFNPDEDMSFRAKASKANARDAVAMLVVNSLGHPEGADDKLYDFNEGSPGEMGFGRQNYGIPMLHIRRSVAEKMLQAAGLPGLSVLERQIEDTQKSASRPLKGVSVKGSVAIDPVPTPVRNVVGLIPGTGPNADEIIVMGAHYDHVGITNKGQPNFDPERDIFNGADDNASGTAMLMTMARAYTRGSHPNRSILLIAFTAEELGLLGSQHFVNQPTVDLDKCVVMFDFDMVGRLKDDRLEIGGFRTGGFDEMVHRLGDKYSLTIKDGGGGMGPSDFTGFYSKHIPVMFFFTGLHKQYHQATDDANLINAAGAMRIAKFAADCVDEIDAKPQRPQFAEDTRDFTLENQDGEGHESGPGPIAGGPRHGGHRLGLKLKPDENAGLVVEAVIQGSPADRAGIKDGDQIIKIGGSPVATMRDMMTAMRNRKRDEKTEIVVARNGQNVNLELSPRGPGRPGDVDQPFGEPGRALIALAQRFQEPADKPDAKPSVSWKADAESITITLRFDDRKRVADFLDQAANVLDQFPKGEMLTVTFSGEVAFGSAKGLTTEISVTLKKQEPTPDSGATKTGSDGEDKAKKPDKPKRERRPPGSRSRQTA